MKLSPFERQLAEMLAERCPPRPMALDICGGAGGLALGLARAGFDVHGIEIDADAVATHRAMVGPCDRSEIECWRPARGAHYHLVAGGVPCQSFSEAGARGGFDDPRGQLFRHLIRIALECHAKMVMMENVPGITTWRNEHGEAASQYIERAFEEAGFLVTSQVLNAVDYGVPQNRERWILVGFRSAVTRAAWRWPAPTHGPAGNLFGLPPHVTVRQALRLGGGSYQTGRTDKAIQDHWWNGGRYIDVDRPSATLATRHNADLLAPLDEPSPTVTVNASHQGVSRERPSQRKHGQLSMALGLHEVEEQVITRDRGPGQGKKRVIDPDRPSTTIMGSGQGNPRLGQGQRIIDPDRPSTTILARRAPDRLDHPAPTITAVDQSASPDLERTSRRPLAELAQAVNGHSVLDAPSPTVTASEHKSGSVGKKGGKAKPRRASERIASALDEPSRTISAGGTEAGGGAEPLANKEYRDRLIADLKKHGLLDRAATTVMAGAGGRLPLPGHQEREGAMPWTKRLSVMQCQILQSFPEDFVFSGTRSSQYKQIGNAVPPLFAYALGRSLRTSLDALSSTTGGHDGTEYQCGGPAVRRTAGAGAEVPAGEAGPLLAGRGQVDPGGRGRGVLHPAGRAGFEGAGG